MWQLGRGYLPGFRDLRRRGEHPVTSHRVRVTDALLSRWSGRLPPSQLGRRNSGNPASRQRRAAAITSASRRDGVAPHALVQHIVIFGPRSPHCSVPVTGSVPTRSKPMTPVALYSQTGSIHRSPSGSTVTSGVQRRRVPRQRTWARGRWQAGHRTATDGREQHGHTDGPRPARRIARFAMTQYD
jgi:hypothetical protein